VFTSCQGKNCVVLAGRVNREGEEKKRLFQKGHGAGAAKNGAERRKKERREGRACKVAVQNFFFSFKKVNPG